MTVVLPGIEVPTGSRYLAVLSDAVRVERAVDMIVQQLSTMSGQVQVNVLTGLRVDECEPTNAVVGWVTP